MLINCPNCTTSYKVDASSVGDQGRTVRCHRCDHVWLATASAEPTLSELTSEETIKEFASELGAGSIASMPAPPTTPEAQSDEARPSIADLMNLATDSAEPGQSEPLALSDITIPVAEAALPPIDPPEPHEPAIENQIPDGASAAARHRRTKLDTQRRARPKAHLTLVVLALALVTASLLNWRKDVVRHLPQLASFYASIGLPVNLRGLTLANVTIGRETSDGVPVLVIDGTILNSVSTPVEIPQLRFSVQNAVGTEVYSWMATPTQRTLEPGATLPFRTRLASPPDNGHNVQVRFFTRRDVVAGLF